MREILVHLDDGERSSVRLDIAIGLAAKFKARLTGLFARCESDRSSAVAQKPSAFLAAVCKKAVDDFAIKTAASGISARWWQLSHGAPTHVLGETMFCARYADLVIMGQHDPEDKFIPKDLVEHTILNCGRPVLVIPRHGTFSTIGERIVLAWNASREAVRAMVDSQPLMAMARSVVVLSLSDAKSGTATGMVEVPRVDIIDYLASCGVSARLERAAGEDVGKMDLLLSRLCDLEADMVVMGGHGGNALSSLWGSDTRYVLEHMTVPVLLSN